MDQSATQPQRLDATQHRFRQQATEKPKVQAGPGASMGLPLQSASKLKWTREWVSTQFGAGVRQSASPLGKHLEMKKNYEKKLFETIKLLQAGSFDSQDSSHTHGSFCIAADHSVSEAVLQESVQEDKLMMAGVLEVCTERLHNLLLPAEMRPVGDSSHRAARARAVSRSDVASLAASLVAEVSAGLQSKALHAVQNDVHRHHGIINSRERQLRSLAKEASRVKRHPLVEQLTRETEGLQTALREASRDAVQRKISIHECAIEVVRLRRIEQEASATLQCLRNCRVKYEQVSGENCELNRTIQQLQGAVRVVCHIPSRTQSTYLEATNRRAVTFKGSKKVKTYAADAVLSGQPCPRVLHEILAPLATSALDGMDVMLMGMEHKESCFPAVMTHGIAALLSIVDNRFYHISCILDFEFSFVSATDWHCVVPSTRLSTALDLSDNSRSHDRLRSIEAWVSDLHAMKGRLKSYEQAHAILKINLQTQQTPNGTVKTSTMSFLQMHPSIAGRWMDDREASSVASVLMELSGSQWPLLKEGCNEPLLAEMLHRNSDGAKLYTLFLELKHAPEYEKRDLTALNFCAKLMASRAVAMDGKSAARQKMALQLNKEIEIRDNKITQLEQESRELSSQRVAVHSDIDRLRAEIAELQANRNAKRPLTKQTRPTKPPRKTKAPTSSKTPKRQQRNAESSKRGSYGVFGSSNGVFSPIHHLRATQAAPPGVPKTHSVKRRR